MYYHSKKLLQYLYTALLCEQQRLSPKEGIKQVYKYKKRLAKFNRERRQFLKHMGSATLIGASAYVLPFGQAGAANKKINTNIKIGIVGAGLGGLTCADTLRTAGFANVYLYEAKNYIGGRCKTLRPDNTQPISLLSPPGWSQGPYHGSQVAENGGELIDTLHTSMRNYATEFKLAVEDLNQTESKGEDFHFYGLDDGNGGISPQLLLNPDVVAAFREFVPFFREDFKKIKYPTAVLAETPGIIVSEEEKELNRLSIKTYLEQDKEGFRRGPGDLLYSMLQENYANEYGDEFDNLCSMSWLMFAHADRSSNWRPYGVFSDERFHVIEGNDLIPKHIAERLDQSKLFLEHKLTSVGKVQTTDKIALTFNDDSTTTQEFDIVVFTLPFSTLRDVEGIGKNPGSSHTQGTMNDIDTTMTSPFPNPANLAAPGSPGFSPLGLSVHKLRAIHNLDYGQSSKIHYAFNNAVWKKFGSNGLTFSDRDSGLNNHNSTWETNPLRATTTSALLTDYLSGLRAVRVAGLDPNGWPVVENSLPFDPQDEAQKTLANLDTIYVTADPTFGSTPISETVQKNNGSVVMNVASWLADPLYKGSYVNNQPNYFIQIANLEGLPDGKIAELFPSQSSTISSGNPRLFFAGEHASPFDEWQGFMEGAVLSGIRAANDIIDFLKRGKIPGI